jgi:hypothetical protein
LASGAKVVGPYCGIDNQQIETARMDLAIYVDEKASLPCIAYDGPPPLVTSLERRAIANYEERAFGTSESDIHTPSVFEETDRTEIRT